MSTTIRDLVQRALDLHDMKILGVYKAWAADARKALAAPEPQSATAEPAALLCEKFAADFTTTPPKNEFERGAQTACVFLADAFRRGQGR